jgi:cytochrome b561
MIAMIALHFLAALWHQFFRRDGLMQRMLPQRSRR